ncbi:zinc-binding oxidoreductase CipB [Myxozyma melibiosi]|uniref:Zinc-binding oxidoreductase CipB n=1 Tax=Myxozyma melibiosi TaxID=54550 RepID=A0ABR1FF54_9ASCO
MPSNAAAFLVGEAVRPLVVGPAPYPVPGPSEIVVKNGAVAINPIEWILQDHLMDFPMHYPMIMGQDLAGEVVEIGSEVSRFKVGDRVLGHGFGMLHNNNDPESAFQNYTIVSEDMAAVIGDDVSFEQASVLPLCFSTAAGGLYQKEFLNLPPPSLNPTPKGETLVIWGGASCVGSNAIQLAIASGYEVIAVASAKNADYVKKLGAVEAFDYRSETVVADIITYLKGKTIAGAFNAVKDGFDGCLEIVQASQGGKFITSVLPVPEVLPAGISSRFIVMDPPQFAKSAYVEYLAPALKQGKYIIAPKPLVIGKGLESIQAGIDRQKQGMSAEKVVISL